jgi:hypothetical protein
MKTLLSKTGNKKSIVIINGLKYTRENGFLTLCGAVRTFDGFHTYQRKQIA